MIHISIAGMWYKLILKTQMNNSRGNLHNHDSKKMTNSDEQWLMKKSELSWNRPIAFTLADSSWFQDPASFQDPGTGHQQGCQVGNFIAKFSKTDEIWTPYG